MEQLKEMLKARRDGGGGGGGSMGNMEGYGGTDAGANGGYGQAKPRTKKKPEVKKVKKDSSYNPFSASAHVEHLDASTFKKVTKKVRGKSVWLLYFHHSSKRTASTKGAEAVEKVAVPLRGIVNFADIDCSLEEKLCKSQKVTKFPAYKVLSPSGVEVLTHEYGDTGLFNMSDLKRILEAKLSSDLIKSLETSENSSDFLSDIEEEGMTHGALILFTSKTTTPALFKALSTDFEGQLSFAEVRGSNKAIAEEFGVKKYPTILIILKKKDGEIGYPAGYSGKITFADIRSWIQHKLAKNPYKPQLIGDQEL